MPRHRSREEDFAAVASREASLVREVAGIVLHEVLNEVPKIYLQDEFAAGRMLSWAIKTGPRRFAKRRVKTSAPRVSCASPWRVHESELCGGKSDDQVAEDPTNIPDPSSPPVRRIADYANTFNGKAPPQKILN